MDMSAVTFGLVFLIFVALAFDFMNGLHDAANSIANIVSTRVLKPQYAVVWAAFFNFAVNFIFRSSCCEHGRKRHGISQSCR
jgi:phosphate/sulfate permease